MDHSFEVVVRLPPGLPPSARALAQQAIEAGLSVIRDSMIEAYGEGLELVSVTPLDVVTVAPPLAPSVINTEREACAKVADSVAAARRRADDMDGWGTACQVAKFIRERGLQGG